MWPSLHTAESEQLEGDEVRLEAWNVWRISKAQWSCPRFASTWEGTLSPVGCALGFEAGFGVTATQREQVFVCVEPEEAGAGPHCACGEWYAHRHGLRDEPPL